jgi:hypothetical protein
LNRPIISCLLLLQFSSITAQHAKVDGYKGIWFTLGQVSGYGDKYSGGLGTYTSSHIPIAVYSKQVNKSFFVYGGTSAKDKKHLLIMISYYDHNTNMLPKPIIVYDKGGVDDPHDNASLAIDEKGYIWVFVSGRNTARPGIIFRTRQPYEINDFEKIKEAEMTYPQPWWISKKGFLYLFTKYTKGRELYWSTSPDGKFWAPDQKLSGMGGHYQLSNVRKNKLITVFNYHPGGNVDKRTNIYFVQTIDMGKTWTNILGNTLQTPLTDKNSSCLIKDFEKEGKLVYLNDVSFDKNGNPVILVVVSNGFQPGPASDPREWMLVKWANKKWNFYKVCESSHNYDMGSLFIRNDSWQIIGPTEPGPQLHGTGGEMAMWISYDEGITWKRTNMLTSNSTRNHSYARRPVNAHDDFYSLWADGNANEFSESKLYFCNKKGEVWMLPYTMKKDFEKPLREISRN